MSISSLGVFDNRTADTDVILVTISAHFLPGAVSTCKSLRTQGLPGDHSAFSERRNCLLEEAPKQNMLFFTVFCSRLRGRNHPLALHFVCCPPTARGANKMERRRKVKTTKQSTQTFAPYGIFVSKKLVTSRNPTRVKLPTPVLFV